MEIENLNDGVEKPDKRIIGSNNIYFSCLFPEDEVFELPLYQGFQRKIRSHPLWSQS